MTDSDASLPGELSQKDRAAYDFIRWEGQATRDELVNYLDLETNIEATDIMRRLRYRGLVKHEFYGGFKPVLHGERIEKGTQ